MSPDHPSVVEGTIQDAIDDGKKLEKPGVDGFDLLAYRFTGDPDLLAEAFIRHSTLPVVIAGSINSYERLDKIKALRPWGFTIGTAFFEKRFSPAGTFARQIERVISYMAE